VFAFIPDREVLRQLDDHREQHFGMGAILSVLRKRQRFDLGNGRSKKFDVG
jgi:hypothetical protein